MATLQIPTESAKLMSVTLLIHVLNMDGPINGVNGTNKLFMVVEKFVNHVLMDIILINIINAKLCQPIAKLLILKVFALNVLKDINLMIKAIVNQLSAHQLIHAQNMDTMIVKENHIASGSKTVNKFV